MEQPRLDGGRDDWGIQSSGVDAGAFEENFTKAICVDTGIIVGSEIESVLFLVQGAYSGAVPGAAVCAHVLYTELYSCLVSRLAADHFSQTVQLPHQCLQTFLKVVSKRTDRQTDKPLHDTLLALPTSCILSLSTE